MIPNVYCTERFNLKKFCMINVVIWHMLIFQYKELYIMYNFWQLFQWNSVRRVLHNIGYITRSILCEKRMPVNPRTGLSSS